MEKDYPMNYEEFKTRFIELYLFRVNSSDLENEKLFLKENESIIKGEYSNACYDYDHYGVQNEFTDEGLINQPVRILEMI